MKFNNQTLVFKSRAATYYVINILYCQNALIYTLDIFRNELFDGSQFPSL